MVPRLSPLPFTTYTLRLTIFQFHAIRYALCSLLFIRWKLWGLNCELISKKGTFVQNVLGIDKDSRKKSGIRLAKLRFKLGKCPSMGAW